MNGATYGHKCMSVVM